VLQHIAAYLLQQRFNCSIYCIFWETDRKGFWQCIYAIIMLKRMLGTAKSQKNWMLQHAAACAQHIVCFAAHSINWDSMHVME